MKDELKYGIVMHHKTGSLRDGTAQYTYWAVQCKGTYRHVEPRFATKEQADAEADRLSALGYEA